TRSDFESPTPRRRFPDRMSRTYCQTFHQGRFEVNSRSCVAWQTYKASPEEGSVPRRVACRSFSTVQIPEFPALAETPEGTVVGCNWICGSTRFSQPSFQKSRHPASQLACASPLHRTFIK